MKKYLLVNPIVQTNKSTVFNGKDEMEAAKKAYEFLAANFNNRMKKFIFSLVCVDDNKIQLENIDDDKYYHFEVIEKLKNNGKIKFTINFYNGDVQKMS